MVEWVSGGVRELGVVGFGWPSVFLDALKEISQLDRFFRQQLKPFATSTNTYKNFEPITTLVRLFYCYCNLMNKIISTF